MPGEALVIDPATEDVLNTELALSEANGYNLLEHRYPDPEEDVIWAGSIATEGERPAGSRPQNRTIPIRLRIVGASDAAFRTAQRNLDKKIGKLNREGGTLQRTLPNGDAITFDVLKVRGGDRLFDNRFIHSLRTEDTLEFVCLPYGRGRSLLRTNRAPNPKAGASTTAGWENVGLTTFAAAAAPTTSGLPAGVTTGFHSIGDAGGDLARLSFDVVKNRPVRASLYVRLRATNTATGVEVTLRDAAVATIDSAQHTTVGGNFVRIDLEGTPAATEQWQLRLTQLGAGTGDWDHTAVLIEYSDTLDSYFDGDTTNARWTGTDEESTSELYAYLATATETSLPVLRLLAAGVPGDVPALGKLILTELQGQDQSWVQHGSRSRHYSADADNALFYEAESRTTLGGASVVTGTAPASGGASNNVVRQATLTKDWQAMLSTQASGGGSHLEHIGVYEFIARVFMPASNTGEVSIRLDWAEGDFRSFTPNGEATFDAGHAREGQWVIISLGQVFLRGAVQGAQRWEGRVVAKSTVVGDDLDVDCFWLRPIDECRGEGRGVTLLAAPTSISARDEFDQTAGALTGKALPIGTGSWSGAGDADDFALETSLHVIRRTSALDADDVTGRYARAGTGTLGNVVAQIDVSLDAVTSVLGGVFARYADVNNWVMATLTGSATGGLDVLVRKRVAGTTSPLARVNVSAVTNAFLIGAWLTVTLVVVGGSWRVWAFPRGSAPGSPRLAGSDADLAASLTSGGYGVYDANTAGAATRDYDNFLAVPASAIDAALFANQSLEIRHDRAIREDSTGTIWQPISDYEGDYLLIPPAGIEDRTTEVLVKASRNDPEWGPDSAIDDLRGALVVTPRYYKVPDAA
jgi:hypothetical protein